MLFLSLIIIVNADLQSNIRLYNSEMVSKSDVRFQFATQRHFRSNNIKIEMISNKTGLFKFTGANDDGYMLTYVIHSFFGRVETKCSLDDCELMLDEKLFLSEGELSWYVKTETDWSLGSHRLADGRVPWKYEIGERVIYPSDHEVRSSEASPVCSSPSFISTSTNNVVNSDGKVIFSIVNSNLLLRGNTPECFIIQGKNNMNDTVNLVRLTIKSSNAWTNYDVTLMDSFAYNWVPVGINSYDSDVDSIGYSGYITKDYELKRSLHNQLGVWQAETSFSGKNCSWFYSVFKKNYWKGQILFYYDRPLIRGLNHLDDITIEDQCICNDILVPSIGKLYGLNTTLICKSGGIADISCNSKDILWFPKSASTIGSYYHFLDKCFFPSFSWETQYEKWAGNYSISGIDDYTLGVFNGQEGSIVCKSTATQPCVTKYIKNSVKRVTYPNDEGSYHMYDGPNFNTKCDFNVNCKSRRIRPDKFFRGIKIIRSSSEWNITVDVEDLTNTNHTIVSNSIILKVSESDEKTIPILGVNSSIKFTSNSWAGNENPLEDSFFSMYEVKGEVPFTTPTSNINMPIFGLVNPFDEDSTIISHYCSVAIDNSVRCEMKNGLYNTGINGVRKLDQKLGFFDKSTSHTQKMLNNETTQMIFDDKNALSGIRVQRTLGSQTIMMQGSLSMSNVIARVIPSSCSLDTAAVNISDFFCNSKDIPVYFYATSSGERGNARVDYRNLTGYGKEGASIVDLEISAPGHHVLIFKGQTENCFLRGYIRIYGYNDEYYCDITIPMTPLRKYVIANPTTKPTSATRSPISPIANIPTTAEPTTAEPTNQDDGSDWISNNLGIVIGASVAVAVVIAGVIYYNMSEDDLVSVLPKARMGSYTPF